MVLMGMGSEKRRWMARRRQRVPGCWSTAVEGGRGCPDQMLPTALEIQEAVDVPGAVAEFALKAKAEGIGYIGCCCGAGPLHIQAMAKALGIQRESSR